MKTSQSFGVHFTIRKGRKKDGKTVVYASITINKEKVLIALKRFVDVDSRDKGHGCVKVRLPEAKETNAYLEEVKFTITSYYQQLQIAGKEITPQLFVSSYAALSFINLSDHKRLAVKYLLYLIYRNLTHVLRSLHS